MSYTTFDGPPALVVTVPAPPVELGSNYKPKTVRAKIKLSKARSKYRAAVMSAVDAAAMHLPRVIAADVVLVVTVRMSGNHDAANLAELFKSTFDALQPGKGIWDAYPGAIKNDSQVKQVLWGRVKTKRADPQTATIEIYVESHEIRRPS